MKNINLKSRNFSLWLLAFCFLLFTGMQCKKTSDTTKEEVLPAETQTGKQTFGCLVNGEVWWLPKGKSLQPGLTASIQFDILSIKAFKGKEAISLTVRNFKTDDNYSLANDDNGYGNGEIDYKCEEGLITITKYDKQLNIISGTFNFKAKNVTGDIVVVKDGRFDLNYTN